MLFKKNNIVVFCGDGITEWKKPEPFKWFPRGDGKELLGDGYVTLIDTMLTVKYPDQPVRFINRGESGETAKSLKESWEKNILSAKPNWLSVMLGFNDVWRQFDHPLTKELHVYLPEFKKTMDELLGGIRKKLDGLIIMPPFMVETDKNEPMLKKIKEYAACLRELAKKHDGIYVDVQKSFDDYLAKAHFMTIAADYIHLNQRGHYIIAKAFVEAMDRNSL
jgi:lysophospholipase L1-like esterase